MKDSTRSIYFSPVDLPLSVTVQRCADALREGGSVIDGKCWNHELIDGEMRIAFYKGESDQNLPKQQTIEGHSDFVFVVWIDDTDHMIAFRKVTTGCSVTFILEHNRILDAGGFESFLKMTLPVLGVLQSEVVAYSEGWGECVLSKQIVKQVLLSNDPAGRDVPLAVIAKNGILSEDVLQAAREHNMKTKRMVGGYTILHSMSLT